MSLDRATGVWRRGLLLLAVLCVVPASWPKDAESAERRTRRGQPHAGYAYPAGGQVGTTFVINVGGQFLRQISEVSVSGDGVDTSVVMWIPPPRPLDGPQRRLLQRKLAEIRDKKMPMTPGRRARADARKRTEARKAARKAAKKGAKKGDDQKPEEPVELPDHPLLKDLESKSLEELMEVVRYFFVRRNPLQRKRSIEETVKVRVRIAPDAEPGIRELRLRTRAGLSNPIRFCVGLLPEYREHEPMPPEIDDRKPVEPPVVINGQILPRDVDRFHVHAKKGQRLLFQTQARRLVPYQADSVPGWMQATLTLYDADGREVAYADEFRFDPDPVLFHEIEEDGEYVLEVRDAISRGRDDFVYRVTVGELPFIRRIFPLGGRQGELVNAEVDGWNVDLRRLPLDTRQASHGMRETAWRQGDGITNPVPYAVSTLPEWRETEPNDTPESASVVKLPKIVNGRVDKPGDVDVFAFEGRGGKEVVVEVNARVLGSPVDSVIRLSDEDGNVIAWNDDHVPDGLTVRGLGLQTHHSDSYLRAKLPKSGTYYVRMTDVTRQGSVDHAYRLRISPPRPDVELYVTPSAINIPAGRAALIDIHALRKDGFDGDIDLELIDPPDGFALGGATIPSGQDHVLMTLTAPRGGLQRPVSLRMRGRLTIDRKEAERPVTPADNVMQAFLWRHLVPAEEFAATVQGQGNWIPIVALVDDDPVRVRRGGKAKVEFETNRRFPLKDLRFETLEAPKGISVGEAKKSRNGFTLEIKADRKAERTGNANNLIVEVFVERAVRSRAKAKGKEKTKAKNAKRETRRTSIGYLPAIPYVVRR